VALRLSSVRIGNFNNTLGSGGDYALELNKLCRPQLKPTNKSYRTDET